MRAVPLADAGDPTRFGGKAAGLCRLIALGLPVPEGFALEPRALDAAIDGALDPAPGLPGPWAARSSAIGEDGAAASFAGQHRTELHVVDPSALRAALRSVRDSGHRPSALAYRARMGVAGPARMAAVVQRFVPAEAAGVLFTRDPVTRDDVRVVEVAPGLGEAVVAGLVTPERVRFARGGRLLAREPGDLDLAVRPAAGGGVEQREERPVGPVLADRWLAALEEVAVVCERAHGTAVDVEFAVAADRLWVLQCRPLTR